MSKKQRAALRKIEREVDELSRRYDKYFKAWLNALLRSQESSP